MADRRSLLSRFWPSSASRRPSSAQTAAAPPPPTTTKQTPPYQSSSPASSPQVEMRTPAPAPTTISPRGETKTPPRKASSSADSKEEPKTSSPPRLTTRSPSSSKPSSPSRFSSQSRSPPQPSSSPQSRSTLPSPVVSTPKRASKPLSPTSVTPPSPKGKKPISPSKDSMQLPTEKISTSHEAPILATKGNDPKLAASQQEAEMNKEASNAAHGLTQEETSFKQDSVEAKPGETKDVKEVMHETINEANDETKKEVDNSIIAPEAKKPNEGKQSHSEKQDATTNTKEILKNIDKSAPSSEEHVPLQKNIRDEMSKFSNKLATGDGDHNKAISDRAVSVITLAGENRGASMHMESDSSKREGPIPIHRSYKIKPDEATTEGDKIAQAEDERSMEDQATEAYVNNNAQAINNSIVFNSSITEGSPGVHMVVNHLHKELKDDTKSSHETRKAQVNMSRAEKLTFQPTVRRRCLRGLLMETSTDSDAENPEKPPRHGCRVSCKKEERENNVDEL